MLFIYTVLQSTLVYGELMIVQAKATLKLLSYELLKKLI